MKLSGFSVRAGVGLFWILVLAGLALPTAGQAQSQPGCSSLTGSEATIRTEGATEQLPSLTIGTCSGVFITSSITVTVTTNAAFHNVAFTGATDAVGSLYAGTSQTPVTVQGIPGSSNTQMSFTFPVTVGQQPTLITIQNLRVNASNLAVNTTEVTLTTAGSGITLPTTTVNSGQTSAALGTTSFVGTTNIPACLVAPNTDVNKVADITVRAGFFPGALNTDAEEYAKEANAGATAFSGNPVTSLATRGSRIQLTFNNLLMGVTYYLPTTVSAGSGLGLSLVSTGTSTAAPTETTTLGGSSNNGNTGNATLPGLYAAFAPQSGSFTAYYEVTSDAQFSTGSATISLYEVVTSTLGGTVAPTVSASLFANSGSASYAIFSGAASGQGSTTGGGLLTVCAPAWSITSSHTDPFIDGATGTYSVVATNSGNAITSQTVTVTDTVPTGVTLTAASGSGWSCTVSSPSATCTRSDALPPGYAFPPIIVTVTVGSNTASSGPNTVTVLGGGAASGQVNSDSTTFAAPPLSITGGPASGAVFPLGSVTSFTLAGAGGAGGTYNLSASSLPAGITLLQGNARTGALASGTTTLYINPMYPGTLTFSVQVTDASNNVGTQNYSIYVPQFTAPLTKTLPNASVGVSYSQQLFSFSNENVVTWSGIVPAGLSLSTSGVLSGTPTTAGSYTLTLTYGSTFAEYIYARRPGDAKQPHTDQAYTSATATFTLVVSNYAITSPATLPLATAGVPYSYQMTANGSGLTWSATTCSSNKVCNNGLPYGLTMSASGLISGTPQYSSSKFTPLITATDESSPVSERFALHVTLPNPSPLSFLMSATTLPDAVIGQPYSTTLTASGGVAPYTFLVAQNFSLPACLNLYSWTGALPSDQAPGATVLAGLPCGEVGNQFFTLVITDSVGTMITRDFTLNYSTLNLAPGTLRSGIVGTSYAQQLTATGGSGGYTFSETPVNQIDDYFATGVSMNAAGLISGTPSSAGSYNVVVKVTDTGNSNNTLTRTISTTTVDSRGVFITAGNQSLVLGANVNIPLTLSGGSGSYTWSMSGNTPPGLYISGSTINGAVTAPASQVYYQFTLQATGSNDTAQRQVTYFVSKMQLVSPAQNRLIPDVMPPATVGNNYSFYFKMAGGTPPYTFSVSPFTPLPEGLTLQYGYLSGTPTQAGTYPISLVVTDSALKLFLTPADLQLVVAPAAAPLNTKPSWSGSISDASLGQVYAALLDPIVFGGTAPYRWAVAPGSTLPAGISLSAGIANIPSSLTGIPTNIGTYSFSLVVSDSASQTLTVPFSLHVSPIGFTLSSGSQVSGVLGTAFSGGVTITGGTGPYSTNGSSSPPGLIVTSNNSGSAGTFSGSPTAAGVFPVTLTFTDQNSNTLTKSFEFFVDDTNGEVPTLTLSPQPIALTYTVGGTAPSPVAISVGSSSGGGADSSEVFAVGVEGLPFGSLNTTTGVAPGTTTLTLNTSNITTPGTYSGLVAAMAAGTVNGATVIPVSLTVSPAPTSQTITFPALSNSTYLGTAPILNATVNSPLTVSYQISGLTSPAGICSLMGTTTITVVMNGAGTCYITASQSGGTNNGTTYAAATSLTDFFTIAQASQTITFSFFPGTVVFGGTAPALHATASSNLGVSYQVTTPNVCSISDSSIRILAVGTCSITASQAGNANYLAATSVSASFTVTSATPALSVVTSSLQPAELASPYAQALIATGGSGNYQWSLAGGSLPAGLILASSGAISGVPTAATAASFIVSVTDGSTSSTRGLTIAVAPQLVITTTSLPNANKSTPYTVTLGATGGTGGYTWAQNAGTLPAGLTLAANGTLSGTPTTAGVSSFTVTVTDSSTFQANQALTLTVIGGLTITTSSVPNATQNAVYTQSLSALGGTGTVSWVLSAGSLPTGVTLTSNGVLTGTPTVPGNYTFTVQATDQATKPVSVTQALSLQVKAALTITTSSLPTAVQSSAYNQTLAATGGTGTLSWAISVGTLPPGMILNGATGAISGTPSIPGTYPFTVHVSDQSASQAQNALSIQVNPPLAITTTSLPNAVTGVNYLKTLAATGGSGTYTWSVTTGSLPAGLGLDALGNISGKATAAGPSSFTVQVVDQGGNTRTAPLSIQVNAGLSITSSATLPTGVTGKAYTGGLVATGGSGGPYTWSVASGSLPAGISLSSLGSLSGNPSVDGPDSFTVQVTDGVSPPVTLPVSINVYKVLAITTAFLPNGTVNQPYTASVAATGGSGTTTWSASGLPAGLSISSGGSITGTATAAAAGASVSVTATDAISVQTATSTLALTIAPAAALNVSPSSLVLGTGVGGSVAGGFSATTSPGTTLGTLTWSVTAGTLPAGVSLNPATGAVTGAVSTAGNSVVTITVTDGKSTGTATVTINGLGLATQSIPAGAATVAYSTTLTAAGGTPPYVFSASGLPDGISISGSGTLSGTVVKPGSYPFTVQASDSQGLSTSVPLTLNIRTAPVRVTSSGLPNGNVGAPYSQTLTASGGTGPYTWSSVSGTLPVGLSVNSTGAITGTPTTPGTSTFAMQATDSVGGVGSGQITIVVLPAVLTITTTSLPNGTVGFQFPSQVLGVTGGISPYTFAVTGGGLPAGMTLASGVIAGTPTASGTFPLTLSITDSATPTPVTAIGSVTLTIRPSTSDLLLSGSSAAFTLTAGTKTLPAAQSTSVQSTVAATSVTYTTAVVPPSPWVSVSTGNTTPSSLSIGLASPALSLAAGTYSATVTLTCTSPSCNGNTQSVAVSLAVTAPPPQLTVGTTLLSFTSNTTPPAPQSQPLSIGNAGSGTISVTSISCEAPWCGVSGVPATLTSGANTQVTVTVDPTSLKTGFYRTAVDVVTSAGSYSIPVTFQVSTAISLTLAPAGSQFQMPLGGAPGNPSGSFLVSASGGTATWTATVLQGTSWLTLNTPGGIATASAPGNVSYSINSNAASLTPASAYYATIEVSGTGISNSPQDYQVILNVTPVAAPVVPQPSPGGLIFTSNAGGSPAGQLVNVYSSSATSFSYQAGTSTTDGGTWLAVTPAVGTFSATSAGQSTVTVNTAGLSPGTYTGLVSYSSTSAAVRSVNVTMIVRSAGSSSVSLSSNQLSPNAMTPQAGCSATALVEAPTALVSNFSAPTSWPTPLAISLVDNCGNFVTDGQITATFSNGDPPLALPLVNGATGLYSATWTPRKASGQITVSTRATNGGGLTPASAQISGAVTPNAAPVISPQAMVHAYNPQVGGALAPGTIIAIYGQNLAGQAGQPTSIPLANSLNGTSVIIGGKPAPLFYVSPGQVNVQVPFELATGGQYQVVLSANGAIATPQSIPLSAAVPGLAAFGDGTIIAQHLDGSLVLASSPAQQGEYIVIYLLGMGGTDNPVGSGNASPVSPLAHPTETPTLTLGGQTVPIAFAGLTPGLVGLYQIDIQIPQNAAGGNQLLIVSQDGIASNTTIVPVQLQ